MTSMSGVRIGILNVCDNVGCFLFLFFFSGRFQIYQMLGAGYGLFELLFFSLLFILEEGFVLVYLALFITPIILI